MILPAIIVKMISRSSANTMRMKKLKRLKLNKLTINLLIKLALRNQV